MQLIKILKYKIKIIFRSGFEVSAQKVREKFKDDISSGLLYILAFCFQIQNAIIVCFGLSFLGKSLCHYLSVIACIFMLLSSYVTGKKNGAKTSVMAENDVLLVSDIGNVGMFFIICMEQFLREFIDDIVLIIPTTFLIFFAGDNIITSIFLSFTLLIVNTLVYVLSYLYLYMKKNREGNLNNTMYVYITEILSIVRYVFLIAIGYLSAEFLFTKEDMSSLDHTEKMQMLNNTYKYKFESINNYISNFIQSYKFDYNSIALIGVVGILLVLITIFIFGKGISIKTHYINSKNRRSVIVEKYINFIKRVANVFHFNTISVVKDFNIIIRNSKLLINNPTLTIIMPIVNCFNMGVLIFLGETGSGEEVYIFLLIFTFLSIIDMANQIKTVLFPFMIPNGEMRNILLFKSSITSIEELVKDKIRLMRAFMIIPYSIMIIEILIYAAVFKLNIIYVTFVLFYSVIMFSISIKLILCADLLYSRYNFKSYEELYENIYDVKIFSKVSGILKYSYLVPLVIVFMLSLFDYFSFNLVVVFAIALIGSVGINLLCNIVQKRGVENFNKEDVQV